jgi:hypothetical protein
LIDSIVQGTFDNNVLSHSSDNDIAVSNSDNIARSRNAVAGPSKIDSSNSNGNEEAQKKKLQRK